MRIAVGCDHRGIDLKKKVIELITENGHSYQDYGAFTVDSVDYPDIAEKVSGAVAGGNCEYGVLICGTGIGMCIAANKVDGIRAALCYDAFSALRARQHNNANILCLGAEHPANDLQEIIRIFLSTAFEGGRHRPRVEKIRALESK